MAFREQPRILPQLLRSCCLGLSDSTTELSFPPSPIKELINLDHQKNPLGLLIECCLFLVSRQQGKAKEVSVNAEGPGDNARGMCVCVCLCIYSKVPVIVFTHE